MSTLTVKTPPLDFAIKHGLFPVLDAKPSPAMNGDGVHFGLDDGIHDEKEWVVSADEMSALFNLLNQGFADEKSYTYYQFERRIKQDPFTLHLSRHSVIAACRYIFLHGVYDMAFWDQLCRRGDSPCEADQIIVDQYL